MPKIVLHLWILDVYKEASVDLKIIKILAFVKFRLDQVLR